MMPIAQCVHRTPSRARIRIQSRKGDQAFFAALQERLNQCEQVTGAAVSTLTGSILIFHKGDFLAIAGCAEKDKMFRMAAKKGNSATLRSATVATY